MRFPILLSLCSLAAGQTTIEPLEADVRLRALVDRLAGSIEIAELTDERNTALLPPPAANTIVSIEVQAHSRTNVRALVTRLAQAGASQVSAFENRIYATVTQQQRKAIAQWSGVAWVGIQERLATAQRSPRDPKRAPAHFEGVLGTRLNLLHQRGLTGKDTRIGILDQGFSGLRKLVSGRGIPMPLARAFPPSHAVENREKHGTACVEIVISMAPGAQLFIASFDGHTGSWMEAANWLLEQGVHIISYSGSSFAAPGDGSDPMSRFITETTSRAGVLWFVASGNTADRHWSGPAVDSDRDGYVDIDPAAGKPYLAIIPMTSRLAVTVRWDDWGPDPWRPASNQDLDAVLVQLDERASRGREVARSEQPQRGAPHRPVERVLIERPDLAGKPLALKIAVRGKVNPAMRIHVFVETEARISPRLPAGSILSPAAAHLALAVGAFDAVTEKIAPYSAFGPTDDGRLKPEVVAPTNTRSATMPDDGGRFRGTSAACPHAAAFAAVLRQAYGSIKADELRRRIMRSVRRLTAQMSDPRSGFGCSTPACFTISPQAAGSTQPRSIASSSCQPNLAVP